MTNFFDRRDRWGNGVSLWVMAAAIFTLPVIGSMLLNLRMDNDVETWLPKKEQAAVVLDWFKRQFPVEDRVLVTWDGSSMSDPRVRILVSALQGTPDEDGVIRNRSPFVDSIVTASDLYERMVNCGVSPEEAMQRLSGILVGRNALHVELTEAGRRQFETMKERLIRLASTELGVAAQVAVAARQIPVSDESADDDWEGADFEEEAVAGESGFSAESGIHEVLQALCVQWPGLNHESDAVSQFCALAREIRGKATDEHPEGTPLVRDCVPASGSPAGMLVSLSEAGHTDEAAATRAIQEAARAAFIPAEALHIGGRAVTTAALDQLVEKSVWNAADDSWWPHRRSVMLLSGAVGTCLAFLFLKSFRLGLLVVLVSYYSTVLSAALVPMAGDNMNMVLIVMPTLLYVATLSGAIHVANYWKHTALEDPRNAVSRAVDMARLPTMLSSFTTALGLLSLLTSDLGPVRQFGLYSAIGGVISLVMILYVLPALLQLWPAPPPPPEQIDARRWTTFARWLTNHSTAVSAGCLVLTLAATFGLVYFQSETKVIKYFPSSSRIVKDSEAIEQSLGGITSLEVVVRCPVEVQQRTQFLDRLELVRQVGQKLREHPEITGVISLADFQPEMHAPDEQAPTFAKIKYNRRSSEVERRIKAGEEPGTESFFATAAAAEDLATPGDAGLNAAGEELWRLTAQAGMLHDADFRALTDEINARVAAVLSTQPGMTHVITGTLALFMRTQLALLDSLIDSFGLTFAVIALLMVIQLRHFRAGMLCMIPNVLPVGMVFGILAWSGMRIDVGSTVTASVALGMAVDSTLHFLTWFQDGIRKGLCRREAVVLSMSHCGPAMWQTTATVAFGLLMLYPAELLIINRFGWLMAALSAGALLGDLVLLPAMLMGPLGGMVERKIRPEVQQGQAVVVDEALVPSSAPPSPHFEISRRRRTQAAQQLASQERQ